MIPANRAEPACGQVLHRQPTLTLFISYTEIAGCLALPSEIFARPGFMAKVLEIASQHDGPPPPVGPAREELLRLLA